MTNNSSFSGAYVPLTMEGNLVVDGVLASCYPSANHDLAHIGILPIKYFPRMMDWIFGEDSGFSVYSKIANDLGEIVVPAYNFNLII